MQQCRFSRAGRQNQRELLELIGKRGQERGALHSLTIEKRIAAANRVKTKIRFRIRRYCASYGQLEQAGFRI